MSDRVSQSNFKLKETDVVGNVKKVPRAGGGSKISYFDKKGHTVTVVLDGNGQLVRNAGTRRHSWNPPACKM